jgi:glycosyltransferase involved in cell wall biosynthesis
VVVLGSEQNTLINFRGPLIKELVKAGHEVFGCAPSLTHETVAALTALGARGFSVPMDRTGMNPLSDLAYVYRLTLALRKLQPDAIIAYTAKPVVYGAIAGRLAGVERVCALVTGLGYAFIDGGGLKRRVANLVARGLYKLAINLADCVIFQNPDDRAAFAAMGLLRRAVPTGVVNGSGVDLDHFSPAPLPDAPAFLMVSRLLGDKGVREYAAASLRLRATRPDVSCVLVGGLDPSPNAIDSDELACWREQGLGYEGHLADVREAIARASIVVLPSYREGTPRAVLEGMAMGRAIITTDVPGCRQTVEHGVNGLLVPPKDAQALERAMLELAGDPGRVARMGVQSRIRAEQLFEARAVARDTLRHARLTATPSERPPCARVGSTNKRRRRQ